MMLYRRSLTTFTSLIAAVFAAIILVSPFSAEAQSVERIAAVVDDGAITSSEVDGRVRLALVASGLANTAENRERLRSQVMRTLIDEELQRQEADRFNIEVTDAQIDEALADIAQRNGMSREAFLGMMGNNGVPVSTLRDQLEAQIAWARLVQSRYGSQVAISESDVDDMIAQIEATRGETEYLLSEIYLSVDGSAGEAEMRQLADRLVSEIRSGASFADIARQFSQGAGATEGGDIGWVPVAQLDDDIAAALQGATAGTTTSPIRSTSGYHIMRVRDTRQSLMPSENDTIVDLRRFALAVPPNAPQDHSNAVLQIAHDVSRNVRGCGSLQQRADELGIGETTDAGSGRLGLLPQSVRSLIADLPIGQPTAPYRIDGGVIIYMVCDRERPTTTAPSREQVRASLTRERLDMMQRRYMRDLRNAAYVEIRE
ncbi:peptidylprolyl isomerase [Fodinicurvata sp. EGI_FJ10296]|uniref:peptidylprolyl isomerase n=1 Tax=Fodinicurvata sp. EGI_FJ10296 TaxID=3231908 RepID=UPI0034538BA3